MTDPSRPKPDAVRRFPWSRTRALLQDLLRVRALVPSGRHLLDPADAAFVFTPPSVQALRAGDGSAAAYLARLPETIGSSVLVLLQAGATAVGYFVEDTPVRHKVIRRYVVRGKGRAQTLHLKTRGKSRYGSRLRLQNARLQLEETNHRLRTWYGELGPPDRVFLSCPIRTRPDLFAADPPPPFRLDDPTLERVPFDVHVPDHEELLRIWRRLTHGEVRE